jgi:hypothetical protein
MIMLKAYTVLLLLGVLLGSASAANAQACEIVFGGGGDSATFSSDGASNTDIDDVEGPWDFIRSTHGPCTFEVFNDYNLSGKSVVYGTDIDGRIRIGETGGQDDSGDGWKARSLRITYSFDDCRVTLSDNGISQTFVGSSGTTVTNISGWSFVRHSTRCRTFTVYNGSSLNGKHQEFHGDVTERVRVGWRIRSLRLAGFQ